MPDTRRIDSIIQQAVDLAADASRIVGCDHLCDALLSDPVARRLLEFAGGRLEAGRAVPDCGLAEPASEFSITPGVRRILEIAKGEAQRLGESSVGPEHVVVGVLVAGGEASLGPAWFPYVGAVASRAEYRALTAMRNSGASIQRVCAAIEDMPHRTLLRPADGTDDSLLRPASGTYSSDSLLHTMDPEQSADQH